MTPSRAHFARPGDETRSGAQDLRRGLRHSARSNRPWSAPRDRGLNGTLASNGGEQRRLRRSAGDLRSVPSEMRLENIFQIYDEQRLAGEDAAGCCSVSQRRYAQRSRRSRREWMGSRPSMRPKNAIGKTLSSRASFCSNPIRTITGPTIRLQKSSRQVGE